MPNAEREAIWRTLLAPYYEEFEIDAATVSRDFSPLWSGQNAAGCNEIPAGELTKALAACVCVLRESNQR